MRNLILIVFALSITVLNSCQIEEVKPDDPVEIIDTLPDKVDTVPDVINTWCDGPTAIEDQMLYSNSCIYFTQNKPSLETRFIFINNGDTSTVFIPERNTITASRKFYCHTDYDVVQWKYTDTLGRYTDWITDTIRYNDKKEIYY